MKRNLLSFIFILALALPTLAQISIDGNLGVKPANSPIQSMKLTSVMDGHEQLFVHEYWSEHNLVYNLPDLNNFFKSAPVTPYINCGDFASDGFLYATGLPWQPDLLKINIKTGVTESVGSLGISSWYSTGMAYNGIDNEMYLLISVPGASYILSIDLTTAAYEIKAYLPSYFFMTLAFDEITQNLYTVEIGSNILYSISTSTWEINEVGNLDFNLGNYFCESDFHDKTGDFYMSQYDGSSAFIHKVNPSDASSTLMTSVADANFIVLAVKNNIIPVPISIWAILSLFGLLGIGIVVRKRFF